ncbi:hypothetical protein EJB05_16626 [Eragrostis curvula]|uniref:Peptidase A1 domain-containing protein n=1 Tax=Eragrostis curvula TaxID=38414 RepID=A0A5J9VFN4_9POAL|nr:hypothetical protein EJB05_16626 [Eragrostis curvula]
MALALASPMASLSLHSGRISAAAIGGVARPCRAAPMGASASPFLRSSFVSSSSTSSASASPASLSAAVSASLAFTSSSSFAGSSLGIQFSYNRVTTRRSRGFQIRAGKAALCMTKRSRSRKSLARTHGFRRRMRTTAGRRVLKRRRDKGRKVSPMLVITSIAALALTLLFITGDAAVHGLVDAAALPSGDSAIHEVAAAAPPPSDYSAIHEVAAAAAAPPPLSGDSAVHEPVAASPSGEPPFNGGFSLPIIHWNAPMSPLRDPTITTLDLFRDEIKLASSLAEASASEKMLVLFHFRRGMYLAHLRIGGSLDRISSRYLMFDTGTDLSWTQCAPCNSCSKGKYPPYDPSRSSTFHSVSCDDPLCEHSPRTSCDPSQAQCNFLRTYGDGSIAIGYLVSDTFHFSLEGNDDYHFEPEVVFGCALSESSTFVREYNTGLLGLSASRLSFAAQVRVDKFSYCVPAPPRRGGDEQEPRSSYLRFGSEARLSGKQIPFELRDQDKYHVYLKSVTYQHGTRLNQQQPVPIFNGDEAGNMPMLVDSGAEMELFTDSLFFECLSNMICLAVTVQEMAVLGMSAQVNANMGFHLSDKWISIDQSGCGP